MAYITRNDLISQTVVSCYAIQAQRLVQQRRDNLSHIWIGLDTVIIFPLYGFLL